MGLLLSDHETRVFIHWLEQTIDTSRGIEEQMKNLPGVPSALVKREQVERAACEIVLRMLKSGETMTIKAKGV